MDDESSLPHHIGFIVDGNRRWAKQHGIPSYEGHLAGYNKLQDIAAEVFDKGVPYMSIYIFSTENWKRSQSEVSKLMGLVLRLLTSDLHVFDEKNVKLRIVGSRIGVSEKICKAIDNAEERTKENTRGTLAVCFNYGGHLEIVDSMKSIIAAGTKAEDITPELIEHHLYAPEIPPIDIIVRSSGEQRLSNFMLWRAAYSEFMTIDKMWPDMTKDDVPVILEEYLRRGRRFGG